jgi:hypothetical protein
MAAAGMGKSAASMARTTSLHVGRGVAHTVQYLPPLLDGAHAPHTQSEAEEEEVMMGWLCVLVGAGCKYLVVCVCVCVSGLRLKGENL